MYSVSIGSRGRRAPFDWFLSSVGRQQPVLTLTLRQGITVVSIISVDECSVAVGNIVGREYVWAASRMNNAIVLFLRTIGIDKANEVEEKGSVVND